MWNVVIVQMAEREVLGSESTHVGWCGFNIFKYHISADFLPFFPPAIFLMELTYTQVFTFYENWQSLIIWNMFSVITRQLYKPVRFNVEINHFHLACLADLQVQIILEVKIVLYLCTLHLFTFGENDDINKINLINSNSIYHLLLSSPGPRPLVFLYEI